MAKTKLLSWNKNKLPSKSEVTIAELQILLHSTGLRFLPFIIIPICLWISSWDSFHQLTSLESPSLPQYRPFWPNLFWLCLFFCPPSANLQSKGSVGAKMEKKERGMAREWNMRFVFNKHYCTDSLFAIIFCVVSHSLKPRSTHLLASLGTQTSNLAAVEL